MAPTIALLGPFRFAGHTRISQQSELASYLAASKGNFLPLYDAEMTCPILPAIKGLRTNFVLLRQRAVMFSEP